MPIRISLQNIPLATDIMSQIAQQQQQATQAAFQPKMLQSQIALRQAQAGLAQRQAQSAGLAKLTPAQQAINAYLTSYKQNPNSANTKLLGLAARKAVETRAGTSITTSDGTQVTFGGPSGTIPTFGGGAIGATGGGGGLPAFGGAPAAAPGTGVVGAAQPVAPGIAPAAGAAPAPGIAIGGTPPTAQGVTPTIAPAAQPQLTPDQGALRALFPEQPQSPVQQLPGTTGSRKVAGSTTVDMRTGEVVSRPTRTVATLNQNSIESARKLRGLVSRAVDGFAPFAGVGGKTQGFWESLKVGTGQGSPVEASRIEKLEAAKDGAKLGAVDLMKTLGSPNAVQIASQFEKILPARWNETPETYRRRVQHDLMSTIHEFTHEAQAAQLQGILFGKIDPKTGKVIEVPAIAAPKTTQATTQSTQALVNQFKGQ